MARSPGAWARPSIGYHAGARRRNGATRRPQCVVGCRRADRADVRGARVGKRSGAFRRYRGSGVVPFAACGLAAGRAIRSSDSRSRRCPTADFNARDSARQIASAATRLDATTHATYVRGSALLTAAVALHETYPSDPSIAALVDRANDYIPALVSDPSLPEHLLTAYVVRLSEVTRSPRAGIDSRRWAGVLRRFEWAAQRQNKPSRS